MPMVGIVIVTHNSERVIGESLDACLRQKAVEVLVVDNASTDRTLDQVDRRHGVRLVVNSTNRGFAAAVNQGIAALETPFVLLLNPDAILLTDLQPLVEAVGRTGVAAAGGKLVNADGSTQEGFNVRGFPTPAALSFEVLGWNRVRSSNPVNRKYRPPTPQQEQEVDQPAGAFLMVRRAAWEYIGGLDERFSPVWFEDVDFCLRLCQRGFRILFVPTAVARHEGGHSVLATNFEFRERAWYGSLLKYAAKHFSPRGVRTVSAAVVLGCPPRMLRAMWHHRSFKPVTVYSRVMWLAAKQFLAGRGRELERADGSNVGASPNSQEVENISVAEKAVRRYHT
jgi:N-acetylglucosaminyl-diphospho-decaprenol L-rhamnosyltransferase